MKTRIGSEARRGSVYLLVLFVSTIAAALALGGLWHARGEKERGALAGEMLRTREIARSALEIALQSAADSETWRDTPGSGAWLPGLTLDGATTSIMAFGLNTGTSTDAACGPFTMMVRATRGQSSQAFFALVAPDTALDPYSHLVMALYPVGYWPMRDIGGNPEADYAELRDAVAVGDVVLDGGPCGTCWAAPLFGDGYYEIDHEQAYELDQGSLSVWFRPERADETGGIVAKGSPRADDPHGFTLGIYNGQVFAQIQGDDDRVTLRGPTLNEVGWVHAVFTWGRNGTALWVNGVLADEGDTDPIGFAMLGTDEDKNTYPWLIGAAADLGSPDKGDNPFNGRIRDVAVFAGELPDAAIEALAAEGVSPAPLVPTHWARAVQ